MPWIVAVTLFLLALTSASAQDNATIEARAFGPLSDGGAISLSAATDSDLHQRLLPVFENELIDAGFVVADGGLAWVFNTELDAPPPASRRLEVYGNYGSSDRDRGEVGARYRVPLDGRPATARPPRLRLQVQVRDLNKSLVWQASATADRTELDRFELARLMVHELVLIVGRSVETTAIALE